MPKNHGAKQTNVCVCNTRKQRELVLVRAHDIDACVKAAIKNMQSQAQVSESPRKL